MEYVFDAANVQAPAVVVVSSQRRILARFAWGLSQGVEYRPEPVNEFCECQEALPAHIRQSQ
jgi:hypothetical protein